MQAVFAVKFLAHFTLHHARPSAQFFNLSGHGHFDMASCDRYFSGKLEDFDYPEEAIKASLAHLPKVG